MASRIKIILSAVVILAAGVSAGFVWGDRGHSPEGGFLPLRDDSEEFRFVEPLLAVGDLELFRGFDGLRHTLETYIDKQYTTGKVSSVSVYYRDLKSGRWMGIGEDKPYAPASMYKVALLLSILKNAEINPRILETRIPYKGFVYTTENEWEKEPAPRLVVGNDYTISDLLYYLIVFSDNDAKNLLHTTLTDDDRAAVFTDLGLTAPNVKDVGPTMSAKSFSLFYRVLYNGTYLRPELSEAALDLLSKSSFVDGIVAGVPEGVPIAHKFGIRVFDRKGTGESAELHDCGIVYYPSHPYFLCVMTRGADSSTLSPILQEISRTTYEYVHDEYR